MNKQKKEISEWKNKYYTAYADMENLRKSIQKDHSEALKYRAEGFVEKLIPSLDSFYIALANEPSNDVLKNYLQGFKFIYNNIQQAIESEGLTQIVPKVGDKFDVQTMHAVEAVETDGPENVIVSVYGCGYMLFDRLIRPSMVKVSKKKEDKVEDKKDIKDVEKHDENK